MARKTIFVTPGLIDLRVITTMGVNVKPNSSNPIGYFGTGLKYALGVLLRNGAKVSILRGQEKVQVLAEDTDIRGKNFSLVFLRREDHGDTSCGFTTELGKNWALWMAFRELYSNTLDEGGQVETSVLTKAMGASEGFTQIIVEHDDFALVAQDKGKYFLDTKPMWRNGKLAIHPNPSQYVFYRGVRVNKLKHPSVVTYNVLAETELSEDRIFNSMWSVETAIERQIATEVKDKEVLKKVLIHTNGATWEDNFNFSWMSGRDLSKEFGEVVEALGARKVTKGAWVAWKASLPKEKSTKEKKLGEFEQKVLGRAVEFCKTWLDADVAQFQIKVVEDLGRNVLGLAEDGKIFLSTRCMNMGVKQIIGTILEEYLHLTQGWRDETREMQNGLLDMVITQAERRSGEPL